MRTAYLALAALLTVTGCASLTSEQRRDAALERASQAQERLTQCVTRQAQRDARDSAIARNSEFDTRQLVKSALRTCKDSWSAVQTELESNDDVVEAEKRNEFVSDARHAAVEAYLVAYFKAAHKPQSPSPASLKVPQSAASQATAEPLKEAQNER